MNGLKRSDGQARSVLAGVGLTIGAYLASTVLTAPIALWNPSVLTDPGSASRPAVVALMILNFAGFVLAGALYIGLTDRGWSYVDLRWPTRTHLAYALAGVVGSIVFYVIAAFAVTILDLPTSSNRTTQYVGDDSSMVLVFMVIVVLFNAPAEEFLFRNVIQKRLYSAFDRAGAIVITSLIFALVHFTSFAAEGTPLAATAVSLSIVFGGSLLFGYIYAKTDNLLVPITGHAAFNLFQFGLIYWQLEYGTGELESMLSLALAT